MADEKTDDEADDTQRFLERLEAKLSAPIDQMLADIRDEYYGLAPDERLIFCRWVGQLAALGIPTGVALYASAKVSISIPLGEHHRELVASPKTLVKAIRAWDQGKEFLPEFLDS
jgi:hypothetical protein